MGGSNQIVDNIKLFAHRQNTDGIDVVSNSHTEIKNVFLRNWDDGIAIKAMSGRDVYDINVHDSIISTDFGWGALEIGAETPTANISNIRFNNIDILHDHAYNAIDIQNSDQANVHDVTYSDIRITNHHGYSTDGYNGHWISMEIERNQWSSGPSAGRITNINLNNVNFTSGQHLTSFMNGYDGSHKIDGVHFINLKKYGQKVMNMSDMHMTKNAYVINETFQ